jgi:hypothetical protein
MKVSSTSFSHYLMHVSLCPGLQAVLLFAQGRVSPSPEVSSVCLAATAQLEALVHPRSLPITGVVREYAGRRGKRWGDTVLHVHSVLCTSVYPHMG